jgi:hypothetical protein
MTNTFATILLTIETMALVLMMGCGPANLPERKPVTIGIDGWRDEDYARRSCEFQKANARLWSRPSFDTECLNYPVTLVKDIESRFRKAVVSNPDCTGVEIFDNESAKLEAMKADWGMVLNITMSDDGSLDPANSVWQIKQLSTHWQQTHGKLASISQTASDVCSFVKRVEE